MVRASVARLDASFLPHALARWCTSSCTVHRLGSLLDTTAVVLEVVYNTHIGKFLSKNMKSKKKRNFGFYRVDRQGGPSEQRI